MNFGLGLVLSFTDNASAGINNAVNSLNQLTKIAEDAGNSLNEVASLSALSVVSNQLGSSFLKAGHTILSTLGQVIGKVNETGYTLMYAENQLNALYASSGKTGAEVISQIQKYAKESMFDFENLIPAVTQLKSVGIEAFDAITSSTGNAQYSLLDYASALASFAPQMKNAYGTGINAAIGAMREYIAEGNAMSLKRGAGLDITGILGEDKGATIEERTRQVADLIEKLGMLDMVDLMKNSPQVKLSNMGDVLFQLKGLIADTNVGGVSKAINEIIDVFYNFVTAIDEARLHTIAENIGSALTTILQPVKLLSKGLVTLADGFVRLAENNPFLLKLVTISVALGGALLVLAGIALKITSALSGVSLLLLTMGKSFSSIGGLLIGGIKKIAGAMLPFTLKLGLMYLAWKSDLFGIRTNVTYFVNSLTSSFKTARQAVNGSVEDLITTLTDLRNKDDFFSNLTIGIMKVQMVFKALADAWGDYTLSEENFLKVEELGIKPLIEAILDLKYRFDNFVQGFKDGLGEVSAVFTHITSIIMSSVKGTFLEPILNGITKLFELLSSGDAQAWYDFGKSFSYFASFILGAFVAFKTFGGVVSIVSKVAGVLGTLWGVITKVGGVLLSLVEIIGTVLIKLGILANAPALVAGAIAIAVATILALVIKYRDEIFSALGVIAEWINTNIIQPVVNLFKGLWESVVSLFTTIGTVVADALGGAIRGAVNTVLSGAINIINTFIGALNNAISLINLIPGVKLSKLSYLDVPQLAKGGIVDTPTMSVVGEAGTEAVVPLENNLGWLTRLADMLTERMIPVNSSRSTTSNSQNNGQSYMTSNSGEKVYQETVDNSVVFNEGAINITVQNATEEEAVNLAKKIMEYIKRQKELDKMLGYA